MTIKIPTLRNALLFIYVTYYTVHVTALVCLFVCFLAPECRELIGYQETITFILNPKGILSKELAAKKKNNVRKKSVLHRITTYGQKRSFFLPVVIFAVCSFWEVWYINHSSSTELRSERRSLSESLNPASWRYSKRSHPRIPPLSSECWPIASRKTVHIRPCFTTWSWTAQKE